MFVVCHILTSLDGKISGDFFSSSKVLKAAGKYGELRNYYDCEATLYGTTTMGEFIGLTDSYRIGELAPHDDYVIKDSSYVVAVDTKGKLNYESGKFVRHGKSAQIIAVLSEQVSESRLKQLRETGVSYIFAGKRELDPEVTVRKLEKLYGIKRMMIAGGGYIDWAFLSRGLIDEVSIVLAPGADGFSKTPSLFMKDNDDGKTFNFHLTGFEKVTDDALWLRYEVDK